MNYRDLQTFTATPNYRVTVDWKFLNDQLNNWTERGHNSIASVDLNPEFQRLHVWTPEQQTKYIEYVLSGGTSGREIYFNCVGWQRSFKGPFVLVDGKQRIQAVQQFLLDKVQVFGNHVCSSIEGHFPHTANFYFNVNDLPTMKDVLKWYLEMNTGGTPHTAEEIAKAKALYDSSK